MTVKGEMKNRPRKVEIKEIKELSLDSRLCHSNSHLSQVKNIIIQKIQ